MNTDDQTKANSHDQHTAVHTPAQSITLVPSAIAACPALRTTILSLTGEAEEAAQRQLDALDKDIA
jgi:hypothetical protein